MDSQQGMLSGTRVLELGSTISGPFCGRLLADFGAEVIKIEDPSGDALRSVGKSVNGKSLYAATLLRNKKNVSVSLRSQEGVDIVKRLVESSDILIENFRPGTLEKWGLDPESLWKIKPDLIIVRISGFGQTGPYSKRPGYGVIGEAISGLRHINGDVDRPPTRMATPLTDYITGLYAAFGATMALADRNRSGKGQCIDAALYECAFSFMEPFVPAYGHLGEVANRAGSRLPGATPNNLYPTLGGNYILIAAFADSVFTRLCQAMHKPQLLSDDRYATAEARNEHVEELDEIITNWTINQDTEELEKILIEHEIPASRVFTMEDIFKNEHYEARRMLVKVEDEKMGNTTLAAPVPKLTREPGVINHTGRNLGVDTVEVLSTIAGYSHEQISSFLKKGVISVGE